MNFPRRDSPEIEEQLDSLEKDLPKVYFDALCLVSDIQRACTLAESNGLFDKIKAKCE
jgi:hypothetical protein